MELYINGLKTDTDESVNILFNKSKTDIENPSAVKNNWSYAVTLKHTANNDMVFKSFNANSHVNLSNAVTGFNPSKKVSFLLTDGGNLVEKGYIKLNSVSKEGYDITLFGSLGEVLYELSYINDSDNELRKRTLADLIWTEDLDFTINRSTVLDAWSVLKGTESIPEWTVLNFMVAYNGVPKCNNFDPKTVWVNCEDYDRLLVWKNQTNFGPPTTHTEEGQEYHAITASTKHFGKLTLPESVTDLEMRDLRSYLLRPVIRIGAIFRAIRDTLSDLGWDLDTSDSFFSSTEFTNLWMTLPCLYNINNGVETGTEFTIEDLLSKTKTPAEYLVSLCKLYCIYIDVDLNTNTLRLTPRERYYHQIVKPVKLQNDKVTPLSFDKLIYRMSYAKGDSESATEYSDLYGVEYGSQKINTGYEFDDSEEELFKNIVYKTGVDRMEQSPYYTYTPDAPVSLMNRYGERPSYTLFNRDNDGNVISISDNLIPNDKSYNQLCSKNNDYWYGLGYDILWDSYPRLDCHKSDNGTLDGSDILVRFEGFQTTNSVTPGWNGTKYVFDLDSDPVPYTVSDDNPELKLFNGKNSYINASTNSSSIDFYTVVYELPSFTRGSYDFESSEYLRIDSMDIGSPKVLYMPETSNDDYGIYYERWRKYIEDLYSVNTKVIEAEMMFDNYQNAFEYFYYFNEGIYAILEIKDYDYKTHTCKVKLVSVQDPNNYLT